MRTAFPHPTRVDERGIEGFVHRPLVLEALEAHGQNVAALVRVFVNQRHR